MKSASEWYALIGDNLSTTWIEAIQADAVTHALEQTANQLQKMLDEDDASERQN